MYNRALIENKHFPFLRINLSLDVFWFLCKLGFTVEGHCAVVTDYIADIEQGVPTSCPIRTKISKIVCIFVLRI